MRRVLIVLVVFFVFAPPAWANYTLGTDNGNQTLVVGAGDEASVDVEYTAFCVPSIACDTAENINSANNAIEFTDNTGGTCAQNSVALATAFRCPGITRTRITGTGVADSVRALCDGVQSALEFTGGGGNDTVTGGGCTGSSVDLGPGDDTAVVNGTVNGGPGRDVLMPGPGVGPNTIIGGDGVDTVSYANRGPNLPVTISLNGAADDGQAGLDNIAADVEGATGGAGADTIVGNNGSNTLVGGDGNDTIDGRGGLDFIDGGPGDDRILARDGAQDRVTCGEGNDTAVVDAFDSVDGCENVDSSRALMPDVDADGVTAPTDCNDHNPKIRPGLRDVPGNGIDEDCSGKDAPFTRITTGVQSLFTFGSVTRFTQLKLRGVPEKARVQLRCSGGRKHGCFRGTKRFRFKHGADTANIRGPIRRTRFKPGSKFEIRVLAPESIGKVVRFTIRRGKAPSQAVLCMPPGKKRPGRC